MCHGTTDPWAGVVIERVSSGRPPGTGTGGVYARDRRPATGQSPVSAFSSLSMAEHTRGARRERLRGRDVGRRVTINI
jgi:hypothetical protein